MIPARWDAIATIAAPMMLYSVAAGPTPGSDIAIPVRTDRRSLIIECGRTNPCADASIGKASAARARPQMIISRTGLPPPLLGQRSVVGCVHDMLAGARRS